jgi:hypothetical protein
MANVLFDAHKLAYLENTSSVVDYESDNIDVALIDSADITVLPQTHDFYNDISAGEVDSTDLATVAATVTTGTAKIDADDTTFSAVTGDAADYIVIYKNTGTSSTSPLCVFFDTATGLPVTPNGGDITIAWNASGIWTW